MTPRHLIALLLLAAPLGAQQQPTARDTALAVIVRARVTDSIRVATDSLERERRRKPGPRVTALDRYITWYRRYAARADSLLRAHLTPVVIVQQPPPDTVIVADSGSIATRAELPRTVPTFAVPAPTRVVTVPAGGDLQAALTTAQRGDEIRLAPGATYTGNFTIGSCGPGWITVSGAQPPAGVRVTPTTAASFAKLVTPNLEPAIQTRGAACGWRFVGIEVIGALETVDYVAYGLVRFGEGSIQTSVSQLPYDLWLDRSYVHGAPNHNNTRCVVLNSVNTAVTNSWISDCHARGFDSQAIEGWNGPGPFLIENNRLEGAGENVMFGGADPGIPNLRPSDITIRRNHIVKPLAWKGGPWSVKNLAELKNAQRVLIESNVLENSWPASQEGMAIVIKSSKDACTLAICENQGTTDVTLRWNIVRSAAVGLNLQARDGPTTIPVSRITVTDNLFDQIGAEGRAACLLWTHDLRDVTFARNTCQHHASVGASRGAAMILDYGAGAARRISVTNNILPAGAYWVFYSGGFLGSAAMAQMVGDGSWRFAGNAIVSDGGLASRFPPGNTFPATEPASSATGPGVDMAELARRTAGVVVAP